MRITPPTLDAPGRLGAEITDVDLLALDAEDAEEIRQTVYRQKLVVFRDQHLDDRQYISVARSLGRPQIYFQDNYHHPEHPEIFVSSNIPMNGEKVGVAGTGQFWHTDYSFFDEPLSMTMVYPKVVPSSRRETLYVDMERIYETLPDELRAYTHTRCFHDASSYYKIQPKDVDRPIIDLVREFKAIAPGAWHPTVLVHPVTGRKSLYVSEGFTTRIEGMGHEQYTVALRELFDFVGRPEHVYHHEWNLGDLMLWDNRTLIHQASRVRPGETSCSYRIGVYDALPFFGNDGPLAGANGRGI